MGNLFTSNKTIIVDGKQIILSPFMVGIHQADKKLFNAVLPYYDAEAETPHIKMEIYTCKNDEKTICISGDAIKNTAKYDIYKFKILYKKYAQIFHNRVHKTTFGTENLSEIIPQFHEYFKMENSFVIGEVRHAFLLLLKEHQNIPECRVLLQLICYIKNIDYKNHIDGESGEEGETRMLIVDELTGHEPNAPDAPGL